MTIRERIRYVRGGLGAARAVVRNNVGARELHVYGGLLVAVCGGWLLSPAITLIALGVVLLVLGVTL